MTQAAAPKGVDILTVLDSRAAHQAAEDAKLAAIPDGELVAAIEAVANRPELKRAFQDLAVLAAALDDADVRGQVAVAVQILSGFNAPIANARRMFDGKAAGQRVEGRPAPVWGE